MDWVSDNLDPVEVDVLIDSQSAAGPPHAGWKEETPFVAWGCAADGEVLPHE